MAGLESVEYRHALRNSLVLNRMDDNGELRLEEAPTYYPTAEQFADPIAFIASIRSEAQEFGACKIVPPAGWRRHGSGTLPLPETMAAVTLDDVEACAVSSRGNGSDDEYDGGDA